MTTQVLVFTFKYAGAASIKFFLFISLDKSGSQVNSFLISGQKHML